MSNNRALDERRRFTEQPRSVRITVVPGPRSRTPWDRLAGVRLAGVRIVARVGRIALLGLTACACGAIVILAVGVLPSAPAHRTSALTRERGASGIAAAYGYPPRCLSITISRHDPAYARADFDHGSQCGQYAGYPTAIFHRIDGAWRPALEAIGYACPVPSLPRSVQTELAVCPTSELAASRGR